jgi:hypothetical protein
MDDKRNHWERRLKGKVGKDEWMIYCDISHEDDRLDEGCEKQEV